MQHHPRPPPTPPHNNVQILQRPQNPQPPPTQPAPRTTHQQQANLTTSNTDKGTTDQGQPPSNAAIKETWAAITATGIDLDGFRLAPARKRSNNKGPGINPNPQQAPSAPSTPHARQRRLIIRSIEKNRRVGKAGITPAQIRDAVNGASNTKFAYAEYNR